nr:LrgB family protein [Oceanococcus sp. HetDA_MAG_MS8]
MATEWLEHSRSFDLLLTLLAYQCGVWAYARSRGHPLLLPVWVGLILVLGANVLLQRDYADYADGSAALTALLGPVIVALAIPLYQHMGPMRAQAGRVLGIVLGTAIFTALSVAALAQWLAPNQATLLASVLPKAATTPIALEIAQATGGIPALAATTVMLTGIAGAMLAPPLLKLMRVQSHAALGLALGISAHAVGTARAFEISPRCGAWSALGMGLTGLLLALVLPAVLA